MARLTRLLLSCGAVLLMVACTRVVGGEALAGPSAARREINGVNVDAILLDQSRVRAIAGAGDDMTIIPTMDGTRPVDIDQLAETAPAPCRFIYAETATFGPDVQAFHKTTFQYPPKGGVLSEGAAAYRDAGTAQRAFSALVTTVGDCAASSAGDRYVGEWKAGAGSLHLQPGGCGRDYRLVSVALLEVTLCGFPQSVSDIVMRNIAANIPR
jgi:hypothetical protein